MRYRRILCIAMSLLLAVSLCMSVFADTQDNNTTVQDPLDIDEEFVYCKILEYHGIEITPTVSYYLYDTSGNATYTCVEFIHADNIPGYAIIDLCSYELTIYSLENEPVFEESDSVIYSGFLDAAVIQEDGKTATDLLTEEEVDIAILQSTSRDGLNVTSISERERLINELYDEASATATESEIVVAGGYDTTLVFKSGGNSGSYTTDCGINALAMYLKQLEDYFGGGYLLSTLTTESKIKISLAHYADDAIGQLTSLSTSQLATLCNGYTKKYGTSYTSVASASYTWKKLKNTINGGNGVPCILRIGAGATSYWSSAHYVIGVGYTSGASASAGSIRINSGFTSYGYLYIGTSIPSHIIK